jgi:hypothetical protein
MRISKKTVIGTILVLVVLFLIPVIPYAYCCYVLLEKFKNPEYIALRIRIPIDENSKRFMTCKIIDKNDIDSITQTLGYKIFTTTPQEYTKVYSKELGVIEFPDIWTRMKGLERNQSIFVLENGFIFWGLPSEEHLVYIPKLRDEFIKLRDKYIGKFSEINKGAKQ